MKPATTPRRSPGQTRWRNLPKLRAVRRALRALIPKPGDR